MSFCQNHAGSRRARRANMQFQCAQGVIRCRGSASTCLRRTKYFSGLGIIFQAAKAVCDVEPTADTSDAFAAPSRCTEWQIQVVSLFMGAWRASDQDDGRCRASLRIMCTIGSRSLGRCAEKLQGARRKLRSGMENAGT